MAARPPYDPDVEPDLGVSGDGGTPGGAAPDAALPPVVPRGASASPASAAAPGARPAEGRPAGAPDLSDPAERVRERLWWAAGVLWRRKWWIVALALLTGGLAAWLSLQVPNRYRAQTRVLLPDSGASGLGALMGRGSSAAAALLGGGGGGYTRYLAILSARTTMEDVVDRFDLVSLYATEAQPDPVAAAVGTLAERTTFDVSLEYDYLAVQVLDEDPARAAQIANAFVEVLNRENVALNQESASTNRTYLERRLRQSEVALDSLMDDMQSLQERYGIVEPDAQSAALMESLSSAGALVAEAEVAYQMLRSELGDENDQTQTAAAGLAAARAQRDRLTTGAEAVMPIALGQLPAVGRRYAQLQQGILLQGEILKELQPLYEQSLLTERRRADAVQVIDPAVPPAYKAEPRRSLIVLAATLSAGLVAAVLALALAGWRRVGPGVVSRLRAASGAP